MTHHVLRWHNNADPRLRNSGDTIEGHQIRVTQLCVNLAAMMGLAVHDGDLLDKARHHDEAEKVLGDPPGPTKMRFPELAAVHKKLEEIVLLEMGHGPWVLTDQEEAILDLCDKLDAWLWARKIGVIGQEWDDAEARLRRAGWDLGPQAFGWLMGKLRPAVDLKIISV